MGLRYQLALGVKQNYEEATRCFLEAAQEGNPIAALYAFFSFKYGFGVEEDEERALAYLKESARQRNPPAQYELASLYDLGAGVIRQNKKQAFKWYEKSANGLYPEGQNSLGYAHDMAEGTPMNKKIAYEWYEIAAAQKNAIAQHNMGMSLYEGDGIAQNRRQAVKLIRMAAKQGYRKAQIMLGNIYRSGCNDVESNEKKAIYWYRKAAEQGDDTVRKKLKKMESPLAKYTIALIEKNYANILNFILKKEGRQSDFFKKEWLGIASQIKEDDAWRNFYIDLQCMAQSNKKNPNDFIIRALMRLNTAIERSIIECDDKICAMMIKMLQDAFLENIEADQIMPLRQCIYNLYFRDKENCSPQNNTIDSLDYLKKELSDQLIKLWHRQESYGIITDGTASNKLSACILLGKYTNTGQYHVNVAESVSDQDLRLLVMNYMGGSNYSVEEINKMLGKDLMFEKPGNLEKTVSQGKFFSAKGNSANQGASDTKTPNYKP